MADAHEERALIDLCAMRTASDYSYLPRLARAARRVQGRKLDPGQACVRRLRPPPVCAARRRLKRWP